MAEFVVTACMFKYFQPLGQRPGLKVKCALSHPDGWHVEKRLLAASEVRYWVV